MKTIALANHDLTVTDFSNFELTLQTKNARFTAEVKTYMPPQGPEHAQLTNPVIEFDDTTTSDADLETIFRKYGFQRTT
jgi:hypothetical protein